MFPTHFLSFAPHSEPASLTSFVEVSMVVWFESTIGVESIVVLVSMETSDAKFVSGCESNIEDESCWFVPPNSKFELEQAANILKKITFETFIRFLLYSERK